MNTIPPLYQWFLSRLQPGFFLTGLIFSLILLSLAGRQISTQNIYDSKLQRFHLALTPETLFYPTASQLLALAKDRFQIHQDQTIAVLIGGSSVFNGVGQSPTQLWTNQLQSELGQQYRVLNLAMRSGYAQEAGALTAQGLLNQGYLRLIYISDVPAGVSGPPDGISINKYLFWDAYRKNLLLKDPDRDSYLQSASFAAVDAEMQRLAWLDSRFYFNDLWSSLGYLSLFTIWNSIIAGQSPQDGLYWLKPRRVFLDENHGPLSWAERYQPALFDHEMNIVKSQCAVAFKPGLHGLEIDPGFWREFSQAAEIMFPDQLKQRSLIVVRYDSPYYRQRLSAIDQQCWHQAVAETIRRYQVLGYYSANFSHDFNSWDYSDRVHLAPSGGAKLATRVASEVRKIADKLGYLHKNSIQ